jgi:predicted acylesterase/phospholipase RssA
MYPFLDGNVRELHTVMQQALVLADGATIRPEHLRLGQYRLAGSRPRIGLALGGGAVRGVAHLGVLGVLERENIPVDLIAGTSVGSLVGALYSAGLGVLEIERLLPTVRWKNLVTPVWPRMALCDNTLLGQWLEKATGCKSFADLKIPFACIAADAGTGRAVILRSGPLGLAIRASTSIPVMMQPVRHENRVLFDGGVVHKVPAILARSMGADVVIAIDVGSPSYTAGPPRNLLDSLLHAYDIMCQRLVDDELEWADVVLRPQAPVNAYSFQNAGAFVERGEAETYKALPLIRQCIANAAGVNVVSFTAPPTDCECH